MNEKKSVERNDSSLPIVSVIIPVYYDADILVNALDALEKQNYPKDKYEVIVVDNGSGVDLRNVLAKYNNVFLEEESIPGPYAARNRGVLLARGTIIAFTDADCLPLPDWIHKGVLYLKAHPEFKLVGGAIDLTFRNAKKPNSCELYDALTGLSRQEYYIKEMSFCVTANMFVYKSVVDSLGGFDSSMMSGSDTSFCYKAIQNGIKLAFAPEAKILHPARTTINSLIYKGKRDTVGTMKTVEKNPNIVQREGINYIFHQAFSRLYCVHKDMKNLPYDVPLRKKCSVYAIYYLIKAFQTYERVKVFFNGEPLR